MILRVQGDPTAVLADLRRVFQRVDPGVAVFGAEPLEHRLRTSLSPERFTLRLIGLFAGVTVLLVMSVAGLLAAYIPARRAASLPPALALAHR